MRLHFNASKNPHRDWQIILSGTGLFAANSLSLVSGASWIGIWRIVLERPTGWKQLNAIT
jgi:hypothetical protein